MNIMCEAQVAPKTSKAIHLCLRLRKLLLLYSKVLLFLSSHTVHQIALRDSVSNLLGILVEALFSSSKQQVYRGAWYGQLKPRKAKAYTNSDLRPYSAKRGGGLSLRNLMVTKKSIHAAWSTTNRFYVIPPHIDHFSYHFYQFRFPIQIRC